MSSELRVENNTIKLIDVDVLHDVSIHGMQDALLRAMQLEAIIVELEIALAR